MLHLGYDVYVRIRTNHFSYSRDSSYGRGRGRSYGGWANRGSPTAKPVEVSKEYEVDVTEISRKGDGIARIEGFVVFVGNITIGKKIRIKVDRFAKATIV